jgi:hypothetical protein
VAEAVAVGVAVGGGGVCVGEGEGLGVMVGSAIVKDAKTCRPGFPRMLVLA